MKRTITIIVFTLLILPCSAVMAQISIRPADIPVNVAETPVAVYDSLTNLVPQKKFEDIRKYVGHEIYFIPLTDAIAAKERAEMESYATRLAQWEGTTAQEDRKVKAAKDAIAQEAAKKAKAAKTRRLVNGLPIISHARALSTAFGLDGSSSVGSTPAEIAYINAVHSTGPGAKPNPPTLFKPYSGTDKGFYMTDASASHLGEEVPYIEMMNKNYTIVRLLQAKWEKPADIVNRLKNAYFAEPTHFQIRLGFLLRERDTDNYYIWYFDEQDENMNGDNKPGLVGLRIGLVSAFLDKARSMYVGSYFHPIRVSEETMTDIDTGQKLSYSSDEKWRVKDITLFTRENEQLMSPYYILEDGKGGTIKEWFGDHLSERTLGGSSFQTEESYLSKKLAEQERLAEEERIIEANRQSMLKRYGQRLGAMIFRGEVELGMTKEMCRDARGTPDHINTTKTSLGVHEQWVYEGANYRNRYLYFDNGKLTSIQD